MAQFYFISLLLASANVSNAFQSMFSRSVPKASPLSDEAIAVFNKRYPFGRGVVKQNPFIKLGMPNRDIDGTPVATVVSADKAGKRMTDISEKEARAAFSELAKLYGAEEALEITNALPIALAFSSKNFGESLKEFSILFGEEKAKAMVVRNPGLLAINPTNAAKSNEQTMVFSYLVAWTRPFGKVLLPGVLFLLLTPLIEQVTGLPIRTTFLSSITGSDPATIAASYNDLANSLPLQ